MRRRGSALVIALMVTALLSLLGLSYLLTSNLSRDRGVSSDRVASALEGAVAAARAELSRRASPLRLASEGGPLLVREEPGLRVEVTIEDLAPGVRPPRGWELGGAGQLGFAGAQVGLLVRAAAGPGALQDVRTDVAVPALAAELPELLLASPPKPSSP